MGDYIVTNKGLVSVDELMHSRKGWTKPNHKYYKREWKNGHYNYYYMNGEMENAKAASKIARDNNEMAKKMDERGYEYNTQAYNRGTRLMPNGSSSDLRYIAKLQNKRAQREYSNIESQKRKENSAKAKDQRSLSYRLKAKAAYYKNKAKAWLHKKSVQRRYGEKVTVDLAVMSNQHGIIATGSKGQYYDNKEQKYVNLGKNFVKKYGL